MAENRHHDQAERDIRLPDMSKPENRHETEEVDVKVIGKFAIGLTLTALVCVGLMIGLFQYFISREGGAPPTRVGQEAMDARQLPPEPRLEETPAADLKEMRDAEDKLLKTYRWVDQDSGIVGLPIDRAMDLVAQRGLPSRPESGPQSAAAGVTVPTESSLGMKVQQTGGPLAQAAQGK